MEGAARGLRPIVHNFFGARELYPASWLFNTVSQAVEVIKMRCDYTGSDGKQYVIDRGWTLESMTSQFLDLVEKAGDEK
jgi:hypothetical protein